MARKLQSMFKSVTPRPGSGERPIGPLTQPPVLGGVSAGAILETPPPMGKTGVGEAKSGLDRDAVAKLAYERWLETGGSAVENWVWAEAELQRRGG
jgi:hypothetical protein